jgi:flagellar basal-body rod modification protein FlgD
MDVSQLNSIAGSGASASSTVASALSSRRAVHATPKDSSSTNGSSSAGSDSSDITSEDFLTLLVSELKNQDPTQPTDPNQYITQLAQVNSLEQLISINQGIGTLDGAIGPTSSSSDGSSANAVAAATTNPGQSAHAIAKQNGIWGGSTAS